MEKEEVIKRKNTKIKTAEVLYENTQAKHAEVSALKSDYETQLLKLRKTIDSLRETINNVIKENTTLNMSLIKIRAENSNLKEHFQKKLEGCDWTDALPDVPGSSATPTGTIRDMSNRSPSDQGFGHGSLVSAFTVFADSLSLFWSSALLPRAPGVVGLFAVSCAAADVAFGMHPSTGCKGWDGVKAVKEYSVDVVALPSGSMPGGHACEDDTSDVCEDVAQ
ncbi:hypothetical protein RF55_11194 [Lasius niger]|uniref:Uncharacterized protein n=1 Tax=Lasius niger TaxID=67767 RepID=A0A0J7N959_LASNI|nr:hypothetical protein RF55_11194 [Lasius niger]